MYICFVLGRSTWSRREKRHGTTIDKDAHPGCQGHMAARVALVGKCTSIYMGLRLRLGRTHCQSSTFHGDTGLDCFILPAAVYVCIPVGEMVPKRLNLSHQCYCTSQWYEIPAYRSHWAEMPCRPPFDMGIPCT